MTLFISNPSRGGVLPSTTGDPVNIKAIDPIKVSLRETDTFINLSQIQLEVGYASSYGSGSSGSFDKHVPRTRLGSIFNPQQFTNNVNSAVVGNEFQLTKTSSLPGASTFFTSLDKGLTTNQSAMVAAVLHIMAVDVFVPGAQDPIGPVIGLEHGPRRTAAYCFFLDDGATKQVRVCGPSVGGIRSPDAYVSLDWSITPENQYILFWNETRGAFELWVDDTAGAGGVGNAILVSTIPLDQFQMFGDFASDAAGGANDVTGIYGVEGASGNAVGIASVSVGSDVGFPLVNGARTGGWKSFLDSDITVGFSGKVDPTRLDRGGAWFKSPGSDPLGQILPSSGGYCRLLKQTPGSNFSIFRDEPGFRKSATDGFIVDFKCATSTSGGAGFATGAAIQISDAQTLFQLDFLFDGSAHNIGLLKAGGDPSVPSDHFLPPFALDYTQRRMRLVVDPRRQLVDLFDLDDLLTPVATWTLDRTQLPVSATSQIIVGFPISSTSATGAIDLYELRYNYFYQAWETRDAILPTAANPPFTAVPGSSPGTSSTATDGFQISCSGGETLLFDRVVSCDLDRGGVLEMCMRVDAWHPSQRTGVFGVLDDGSNAYMISFVETDSGKFVCVPLSGGTSGFQEFAGESGQAAHLSTKLDWTQFHTYRLERRPRDGLYLYIDNEPSILLKDEERWSFPATQFHASVLAFGQVTDEGAVSVWKFIRGFFGSGYEISAKLNQPESEIRRRLDGVRTTIVVTAGV